MKHNISRIEALDAGIAAPKRKFLPNIAKALNKSRQNDNANKFSRPDSVKTRVEPRLTRSYQNGTQRSGCQSTRPQFVHSYSIFETGIGCIAKPDKNTVELCETKEAVLPQTEAVEFSETESHLNPLNQCEAFVTDIKQLFKNPPIIMNDSASGQELDLDPFRDLDLSDGWSSRFPFNLFSDSTTSGRLFTLQLPDKLLPSDGEQMKEGLFGKIQLLDNQEVRLVVGSARFNLSCPRPLPIASDVVLVNQDNPELICLDCIGHLEQTIAAVPDLETYVHLGK
ncbi:hypothetical protein MN116_006179 [Schistosoma mekongi]|uniref:Rab-gap/tbc-related protein n=1 Tax=Schistosoma mekongi TaxID=38744 RepID=A0AAE1ZAL8_SCHME|nr:hypothetical protein MN116_006179 [Schistosoma mekongi]